jgi:hypothetical protein
VLVFTVTLASISVSHISYHQISHNRTLLSFILILSVLVAVYLSIVVVGNNPCPSRLNSIMSDVPFAFSQVPGDPSFRSSSINAVAVVPLLSSDKHGELPNTFSVQSYANLCAALQGKSPDDTTGDIDILLVVPNSSLTRPGDWRYNETPLKSFHWQYGCQRMRIFDGRPQNSRLAHDRVMNHSVSRDWIDLCPSRRTAAVIGVLNLRDCQDMSDLKRAEEELHQWANRYASPPYEVTAHGRNFQRDTPVERLFVFDSFDEACQKIDLTKGTMGSSMLAFPPLGDSQMMDLHLNVVVNDLAVAIFRNLESKIIESEAICSQFAVKPNPNAGLKGSLTKILQKGSSQSDSAKDKSAEDEPVHLAKLSLSDVSTFVSPKSKLAKDLPRSRGVSRNSSFTTDARTAPTTAEMKIAKQPKLLSLLDQFHDLADLSARDVDLILKRDLARREKYAADISLLAGSPLDAYERYLSAAELCKSLTDPLWYASALEGCATAHIAMAEAGGYGVDEYLENNFQMPDEIMALAKDFVRPSNSYKQTLPEVVFALCDEALNILNRHRKLAPLHAELLLKMAEYVAESAEMHLRCRWGEGQGCYAGEPGESPRWHKPSVFKLTFGELKTKDGSGDMISINTFNRMKQVSELLQEAVSVGPLNPTTRVDVAARCARLCLDGVKVRHYYLMLPVGAKNSCMSSASDSLLYSIT